MTAVVYQLQNGKLTEMSHPPGRPSVQSRGQVFLALHGHNENYHYNTCRKFLVHIENEHATADTSSSTDDKNL